MKYKMGGTAIKNKGKTKDLGVNINVKLLFKRQYK